MVKVAFTENIQRHVACPPTSGVGTTVREVLASVFRDNERAKAYVLDDQGALRTHIIVFVNGHAIRDRAALSDAVPQDAEVHVMQALSGG